MRRLSALLVCLSCLAIASVAAEPAADRAIRLKSPKSEDVYSEARVALVIGNGAYQSDPLRNPVNDAEDMVKALTARKFEVVSLANADKRAMEEAIEKFGENLKKGGTGVFYYSGHGVQVDGINYLIPIAVDIQSEKDIKYKAVNAGLVLSVMEEANNRVNVVILDACRDNPYARSFKTLGKGLVKMDAPKGTFIAYATAPGKTAADGDGRNGLYTRWLLAEIAKPGQKVEDLFKSVRENVVRDTGDKQVPWDATSLIGNFFFTPADFDDGRMALTEAELRRLRQLEEEQRKADVGKARIEAEAKARQDALDKEVAKLKAQLKVRSTSGTLDALAALAEQREKLDADLREAQRKADEERAKRETAIAQLKAQERANRRAKFEERYAKYTKAAGSKFLSDEEKATLWKAICEEWQVAKPATTPGELAWDEDNGCAVACVDGFTPRGTPGRAMTVDLGGGAKMEMVWIPAGEFNMGSDDGESYEKPIHRVKLTKGFWMGKYEVTQEQWKRVMGNNPSYFQGGRNPVERVSWSDCQEFIRKLNVSVQGSGFRLPTEAEWEYGCRAGTTTRFHSGNADGNLDGIAWYGGNSGSTTHPVVQKQANPWGLHDMSGNVWEWCQDWYANYPSGAVTDPTGTSSGSDRVLRGGSWGNNPVDCRSAFRNGNGPSRASFSYGFRVVVVGR
jgi:formylglycine-generating enzyme required for sulfatase activity